MTATEFIDQVLVRSLGISRLVVGPDAAFGRGREGNIEFLTKELPKRGIELSVLEELELAGVRPSSRVIRELIGEGELERAARLLGRNFSVSARVGHGDSRGRQIGFPTANLICGGRLLPKYGVYACRVTHEHRRFNAVCNIGVRPTFAGVAERVEVHLLDFAFESLYEKRLEVEFVARIRDEMKFSGVQELTEQIGRDVVKARELLG
jgi:riboflavin kinase/FMN adenylyltransferase